MSTKPGRPPAELSPSERVGLIELNGKLAALESEVRAVREQRTLAVAAASQRGASHRAIAEALGITKQAVADLLRDNDNTKGAR